MRGMVLATCLLMVACADALPGMQQAWAKLDPKDQDLVEAGALVDKSALGEAQKILAKTTVRHLLQCKKNLDAYAVQLEEVTKKNDVVASNYAWANSLVGAGSAAAAPAILASAWTLIVPAVAFVWEVFGLTTLKSQVQPKVDEGKTRTDTITKLKASTSEAHEAFVTFVMSNNSTPPTAAEIADASAKHEVWRKQAEGLIKRISDTGLCSPPIFGAQ